MGSDTPVHFARVVPILDLEASTQLEELLGYLESRDSTNPAKSAKLDQLHDRSREVDGARVYLTERDLNLEFKFHIESEDVGQFVDEVIDIASGGSEDWEGFASDFECWARGNREFNSELCFIIEPLERRHRIG